MIAKAILLPTFIEMLAGCCIVNEVPGSTDFFFAYIFSQMIRDGRNQVSRFEGFIVKGIEAKVFSMAQNRSQLTMCAEIHLFDHRRALTLEQ